MGFLASKIFLIVILSLIAVTTFLQCLGITLDYWWRTDDIDIGDGVMAYVSGGLWGACQTTLATGSAQCAVYPYVATLDGKPLLIHVHQFTTADRRQMKTLISSKNVQEDKK